MYCITSLRSLIIVWQIGAAGALALGGCPIGTSSDRCRTSWRESIDTGGCSMSTSYWSQVNTKVKVNQIENDCLRTYSFLDTCRRMVAPTESIGPKNWQHCSTSITTSWSIAKQKNCHITLQWAEIKRNWSAVSLIGSSSVRCIAPTTHWNCLNYGSWSVKLIE